MSKTSAGDVSQIGQLIILGFDGTEMSPGLASLLKRIQPAGVILFGRNVIAAEQTHKLLKDCQACVATPLFTCVDLEGGRVDRSMVILDRPIKTLGVHAVRVRLHPEVTVTVNINIARSQDEAERQAKGENVITSAFEEDRALDAEAAANLLEGGAGQQMIERDEY